MSKKTKLTDKQQLFISFYAACLNATEAARQAGYQHPRQMGAENLSKPVIRAAIDRLLKEKTIQPTEVLARLSEQATGDYSDFFDIQKYTGQPVLNLEKAAERGKLHLIKKIKFSSRTGFLESIELHDPQAALAHLGKAYALFTDKVQIDDWRSKAIDLIRNGEVDYPTFAEDFGTSLADDLFRLAGIPTSPTS